MSTIHDVKIDTWKRLYELAADFKKLAPWEYMEETDIVAFQQPQTQRYGFMSVMGMAGEHTALALYHGAEAYFKFLDFQYRGIPNALDLMFTRQTQLSFEDREMIEDEDRAVLKELGLRFRGRGNWPQFRSYRYGMFPWIIDQDEAEFLIAGLEQILEVAPRFEEDPDLLMPPETAQARKDSDIVFCRVPVQENESVRWEEQFVEFQKPEPEPFKPIIDIGLLTELKPLPQSQMTVQVAVNILPSPIMGEAGRPVFPAVFMAVDKSSKMLLATEMMEPRIPITDTWQGIAPNFMTMMQNMGAVPKTVEYTSDLMEQALKPVANVLDIRIKRTKRLEAIDEALESLASFLGGGDMPVPDIDIPEDIDLDNIDDVFNLLDSLGFSMDDLPPLPDDNGGKGSKKGRGKR